MPGSPASPEHPTYRMVIYAMIGLFLATVSGLQNGLLVANLAALQGGLEMTPSETGWLTVAYSATNACASMLLLKVRREFGIQRFVRYTMAILLTANGVQLLDVSMQTEMVSRAMSGFAASGLVALSMFYVMQGLPRKIRIIGVVIALGTTQVAAPFARMISPVLVAGGSIENLLIFQFALSVIAFGLVTLLPVPQGERVKSFVPLDLVTLALMVVGLWFLCGFLVQGRIQWWDMPWLGYALAMAILCLGAAFLIEHFRVNPMLFTRWMTQREILSFAATGAIVRVLLSEQNFGAAGLLTAVGMSPEQLVPYQSVLTGAALMGMIVSVVRVNMADLARPLLFAIAIIAVASFADTRTGIATRPHNLYLTQGAIAFAAVSFMGPMMLEGFLRALGRGPGYLISFMAIFSISQTVGGLLGVAGLSAFHTYRLKEHLAGIGMNLSMTDPTVGRAVSMLAQNYRGTISDPAMLQAQGVSQLVIQANQQAAVMAYNDVCFLTGCIATFAFIILAARWTYYRIKGINPLQAELAAIQAAAQQPGNAPS